MPKLRRITANLPSDLVQQAITVTGSTLTETLIAGLELIQRRGAYRKAQALKGKLKLDVDLKVSRERSHR